MTDPLAKEKTYLKENQAELAIQHPGKYLLIKDDEVHGAFETYEQGVSGGAGLFGAGPFLVRSVLRPRRLRGAKHSRTIGRSASRCPFLVFAFKPKRGINKGNQSPYP